jgi:hypothetical protein
VLPDIDKSAPAPHRRYNSTGFYGSRRRLSLGLLLFVVLVGLPIVGIPSLRNRLSARVMALKVAFVGGQQPAVAVVGANQGPVPEEYQRPEPVIPKPPVFPSPERIFTMDSPVTKPGGSVKVTIIPKPAKSAETTQQLTSSPASDETVNDSEESQVLYQRGKAEQAAYDLLLQSIPAIAGMVQGKNPALKFRSWDAANRGGDTYWVRLTFQTEGNADAEYIWTVKVQEKQVAPLNFNARSIN